MAAEHVVDTCPTPKGILVIIGGKEGKNSNSDLEEGSDKRLEVLETFVKLIKKDDPTIEVITSASEEGQESFEDYKKVFSQLNITKVGHIHHTVRKEVLEDDLASRVQQA